MNQPLGLQPGHRQLFLDDHAVAESKGLTRRMHQPTKQGPVLKADTPTDGQYVCAVAAPMWVPGEDQYRMVYECRHADGRKEWALAVSPDGIHWEKPLLGAVEANGSTRNNLFPTPNDQRLWQVVFDPNDPEPTRRFKGFLGKGGRRPVVSGDGIHWRVLDVPTLPSGDAGTLSHDRPNGRFLGLLKTSGEHGRAYNLSISDDFETWSEPRFCFGTDEEDCRRAIEVIRRRLADPGLAKPLFVEPDPAWGMSKPDDVTWQPTWRAECYNMAIFPYEGVYVGLPMMFYPTGTRLPDRKNTDGFDEIQLAMSRDLEHWTRLGDREPFIETSRLDAGLVGNYDRLQLVPCNEPVAWGDELRFYYTGMKRRVPPHEQWADGSPRNPATLSESERADWLDDTPSAICLATLRRDGFISLDAGTDQPGYVLTHPFTLRGRMLHLNLDAPDGHARVEVCDASGAPISGYALHESAVLSGDDTRMPVSWYGAQDLTSLAGLTVQLRIELQHASLYAYWVE